MSEAADGQLKAAAALSRTVLHPDVRRVVEDYERLDSEEARARYADHFLGRTAHAMDEIWPTFYELLKRVEDGELYRKPGYLGGGRTFASFSEYFEYRAGRPFETWSQMESTVHYATRYAPDLLKKAFNVAKSAKERVTTGAQEIAQAVVNGLSINSGDGPIAQGEKANRDNITVRADTPGGTNAVYLMRRIARDRPDILTRAAAGEFPSVRAAAVEAGITPRTQTIRIDDAESAARTIRTHMPPDTRRELARLLLDD